MPEEPTTWCRVRAVATTDGVVIEQVGLTDVPPRERADVHSVARLVWLAATGEDLARHPLRVVTSDCDPTPPLMVGTVPTHADAVGLRVEHDEEAVTARLGERAPALDAVIEGDLSADDAVALTVATDPPEARLEVGLLVGERWRPLAHERDGDRLVVDLDGVGGRELRLEVSATHAVRSAVERFGPFDRREAPVAWAIEVSPAVPVAEGTCVELVARDLGPEGRDPAHETLRWASDLAGEIATGRRAVWWPEAGEHRVQLLDRDAGLAATLVVVTRQG